MRRGITATVGVVLLIATAVIGAGAMYFFTGGLATQEPSTDSPTPLTIVPLGDGEILVANLGSGTFTDTLYSTDLAITVDCPSIAANEQASCTVSGITSESSFVIYGPGASGVVLQTAAVFETGGCDWTGTCEYTWGGDNDVWEDGRNWGNENVGAYPNGTDVVVVFDATSGDCTTMGDLVIGELVLQSGYTGTITLGGDLTVTGESTLSIEDPTAELDTSVYDLTVVGTANVSGTLTGGSGNHSFGYLKINSGGKYTATNGTTTMNNTMNRGTIELPAGAIVQGTGDALWLDYATVDWDYGGAGTRVLRDLIFGLKASETTGTGTAITLELYNVTIMGELNDDEAATVARVFSSSVGDTVKFMSDGYVTSNGTVHGARTYLGGRGTWTHANNAKVTFNGGVVGQRGYGYIYVGSAFTFYDLAIEEHDAYRVTFGYLGNDAVTVENSLTVANGSLLSLSQAQTTPTTLYLGTASSAAAFANNGSFWFSASDPSSYNRVHGVSNDYKAVCTGNDWGWSNGKPVEIKWIDYQIEMTIPTGGDVKVTGDVLLDEVNISTGSNLTNVAGSIVASGNWTNNGNFTHGDGLVEFDSDLYVTSGISAFDNVTVSSGTTVVLDNTTADYTYIDSGATLNISAGTMYTCNAIAGPGTLNVLGARTC